MILLLETATERCSVALWDNGTALVSREGTGSMQHAAVLMPLIDSLFQSTDLALSRLSAVAVSIGPGSYTSLRIGLSTAKAICLARDLPLLSINTLESIYRKACTWEIPPASCVLPVLDARRLEVYTQVFREGTALGPPTSLVLHPEVPAELGLNSPLVFAGPAAGKAAAVLHPGEVISLPFPCEAVMLGELADAAFYNKDFSNLASQEPLYLKPPNITTPRQSPLS